MGKERRKFTLVCCAPSKIKTLCGNENHADECANCLVFRQSVHLNFSNFFVRNPLGKLFKTKCIYFERATKIKHSFSHSFLFMTSFGPYNNKNEKKKNKKQSISRIVCGKIEIKIYVIISFKKSPTIYRKIQSSVIFHPISKVKGLFFCWKTTSFRIPMQ